MSGIVTTGRKTFKDTAGANTYTIGADATRVTISGKMTAGDIINLEGLASEYTASASGRTITLKSATQTVTFQLSNNGGAASVRFMDGELTAGFATKGGATLGGVKLTKKPVDIDDSKLNDKVDSSTVDFTGAATTGGGSTGGGTTPVVPGSTFNLTTDATDLVTGTTKSDNFIGLVSATASKSTFNTGDTVIDGSTADSDVVTLTAQDDVTAVPTIKGVEKIKINVDTMTTPAGTGTVFNMATTNIDATTYDIDNVKVGSAVTDVSLTALKDGAIVNSTDKFSALTVTADAGTSSLTLNAAAKGSVGAPTSITATGAMSNLTVAASGHATISAAGATGSVAATAAGNLTITTATAAVALSATTTAGNIVITDADSAVIVNAKASGNITSAAAALKDVKSLNLDAGGTVIATLATGSTLAAATLAGKGASNTFTDTDGSVVELNLKGNGAATTFTLAKATADKLNTVNISGNQNVTIAIPGAAIDALTSTTGYAGVADAFVVNDNSTGTSRLKITTSAGTADLSNSAGLDEVELAFLMGTKTLTLPAATTLLVSADQGTGATTLTVAGPSATKKTNSLSVTLDDGTDDANVADFVDGTLLLDDIKTVTIDASVDTASDGTSAKHSLFGITGTDQNSNVSIKGGVNALDLAAAAGGAISLGTGKLTVTGSGAVAITHATGTLSAAEFDGSGLSGAVTAVGVVSASVPVFKTGSGDDAITLITAAGAANSTIESGAGNDTITLFGGDYGAYNRTINMGDGSADKLVIPANAIFAANTGKTITVSGIETLEFSGTGSTIAADLLAGKTYKMQADGASKTYSVTVEVGSSTAIDLSTLAETSVTGNTVAGMTFITDASSKTSAHQITGMSDAINTITGSSAADVLIGGAKADTLKGGLEDTLTGGAGIDAFDLTTTAAGGATATKFVTITDFVVNSSATATVDTLNMPGTAALAAAMGSGWTRVNGIQTKSGATLSDFVTAALAAEVANATNDEVWAYVSGTDLYIYSAGADATVTTDNVLVKLTGIANFGIGVETAVGNAGFVTVT